MPEQSDIEKLALQFRSLGARDSESWARSQIRDGIPQYQRFVFLMQAWRAVIADGDTSWIESRGANATKKPTSPGSGAGAALNRILKSGASREDISELVRTMQWETLFALTYLIDDSSSVDYPSTNAPHVNWALVEVDENDSPIAVIDSLHESVLKTDPSGREMRPRSC